LVRAGEIERAIRQYREAIDADPALAEADFAESLGIDAELDTSDVVEGRIHATAEDAPGLPNGRIERPRITFQDVGGMESLKEEIRLKIIHPLTHAELNEPYGNPLFNLLLRVNRLGRLALSRQQIWASHCVGVCLLLALIAVVEWAVSGDCRFGLTALVSGGLMVPVATTFKCTPGWPRLVIVGYTILLAMVGITTLVITVCISSLPENLGVAALGVFKLFLYLFLWGTPDSTWLYSLFAVAR
jgi:hypothetical protein